MGDWAASYDTQCEAEGLEVSPKKEADSNTSDAMIRSGTDQNQDSKTVGGAFGGNASAGGAFGSTKTIGSGKMVASPPPQTSFGATSSNRLPPTVGGSFGNSSSTNGPSAPDGRGAAIGSPEFDDDGPMGGNVISIGNRKPMSQSRVACTCTKNTNSLCRNTACLHGNNRNRNVGSSGVSFGSKPSMLPRPTRYGDYSQKQAEETKLESEPKQADNYEKKYSSSYALPGGSFGRKSAGAVGGGFGASKPSMDNGKATTFGGCFGATETSEEERSGPVGGGFGGSRTTKQENTTTTTGGRFGDSGRTTQSSIGGGFGATNSFEKENNTREAVSFSRNSNAGPKSETKFGGGFGMNKQSSESNTEPQKTSNVERFVNSRYGQKFDEFSSGDAKKPFNQAPTNGKSSYGRSGFGGTRYGDRQTSAQKPSTTEDSYKVDEHVLQKSSTAESGFSSSNPIPESRKSYYGINSTTSSTATEAQRTNTTGGRFGSSNYTSESQNHVSGGDFTASSTNGKVTTTNTMGGGFGSSRNNTDSHKTHNSGERFENRTPRADYRAQQETKLGGGFGSSSSSKNSSDPQRSTLGGGFNSFSVVSDAHKPNTTREGFGNSSRNTSNYQNTSNSSNKFGSSNQDPAQNGFGSTGRFTTRNEYSQRQNSSFGNSQPNSDAQKPSSFDRGLNDSRQSEESPNTTVGGGYRPTFGQSSSRSAQNSFNSSSNTPSTGVSSAFKNLNPFNKSEIDEANAYQPKSYKSSFAKDSQSSYSNNYSKEIGKHENDENEPIETERNYGGGYMGAPSMRGDFQGGYRGGRGGGMSDFAGGQGQTHSMSSRGRGGHMGGIGRGMNDGQQFQNPTNYSNQGRSPFAPNNGFSNGQAPPNQITRPDPKFRYVANKQNFDVHEKVPPPAEIALLNKYLHKEVEMMKDANVEVQRQDPKSPLYSLVSFKQLRLKAEILQALNDLGFEFPTRIQETALPLLLMEPPSNLIAQAQSGTGKTAAFVLTMLGRIDVSLKYPQCICLAPTLELAKQIGEVVEKMGKYITDLKIHYAIKGGNMALMRNHKLTEQIVIGTPGITRDYLMKYQCIDPSKIRCLVLDEADVMIYQQGFNDISTSIYNMIEESSPSVQSMLFSATYDAPVIEFATKLVKNAIIVMLKREEQALPNIKQFYVECANRDAKYAAIVNLYSGLTVASSVIFCHTKASVMWLCENMRAKGHMVDVLHGDMTVVERADVIIRFKQGIFRVLITTNVFARGIDVTQVSVVINYDLPIKYDENSEPVVINNQIQPDCETYLHRIGRTGRFGKQGIAINLIDSPDSMAMIKILEDHFKMQIRRTDPSNIRDLEEIESST